MSLNKTLYLLLSTGPTQIDRKKSQHHRIFFFDRDVKHHHKQMSHDKRFPTMWYVRLTKPQVSLRIRAVWSGPMLVAYFMRVKLLTEHHLEFLILKGGCTGSSESTLVKIPHCWKSHVAAQIILFQDNKHRHTLIMSPDASYLEHQQRHEEEKLQHCISALTDDDRKAIFKLGMYVYIHLLYCLQRMVGIFIMSLSSTSSKLSQF